MSYSEFEKLNELKFHAASDLNLAKTKFEEALAELVKTSDKISEQVGRLERVNTHFRELVVHTDVDELHKDELNKFIQEELHKKKDVQENVGRNFEILNRLVRMLESAIIKVQSETTEQGVGDLFAQTMSKVNDGVRCMRM